MTKVTARSSRCRRSTTACASSASRATPATPLERLLRDALVFPLYDGGNMGVRRRQLHEILRQPGYHSMLAARGEVPPWLQ